MIFHQQNPILNSSAAVLAVFTVVLWLHSGVARHLLSLPFVKYPSQL